MTTDRSLVDGAGPVGALVEEVARWRTGVRDRGSEGRVFSVRLTAYAGFRRVCNDRPLPRYVIDGLRSLKA